MGGGRGIADVHFDLRQTTKMATPYPPQGSSSGPCSKVELSISCSDLLDKDLFSKSDPIAAVYTRPHNSKQPFTEVQLTSSCGYAHGCNT